MADGPVNTTVNGREVSYVNLGVQLHAEGDLTFPVDDLKDISWQSTVTVGKAGGPGGSFTRRTTGRTAYTCSCILYRSGKLQLIKQLGDIAEARGLTGPDGEIFWGRVESTIQVTFSYLDSDAFQTVELVRARFVDDSEKSSEGEAAQESALGIDVMKIFEVIGGKRYAL
jgi:hypothetical protein